MNRYEAIKIVSGKLKNNYIAVFTTGMISREAFAAGDRQENFYMIGSMGLAASVGLGISLSSRNRVAVFDGDGSALMDTGNFAMIGCYRPSNLVHIVLDNGTYQSTGGQPTITDRVSLDLIAKASGYRKVYRVNSAKKLKDNINKYLNEKGPVFILIKVSKFSREEPPRIKHDPVYLSERLRSVISESVL